MRFPSLLAAAATAVAIAAASGCGSSSAVTSSTTVAATTSTTTAPTTSSTAATTTTAPATTTTTTVVPACATDGLSISVGGATDPGAGSVTYPLTFTNQGTATCSVDGFPGVSVVNAQGAQIGQPATRSSQTPSTVVLAPGHSATALLRLAQAANFDPATCGTPAPSAGLRIFPPAQTASVVAAAMLTICPGAATQLQINPVTG